MQGSHASFPLKAQDISSLHLAHSIFNEIQQDSLNQTHVKPKHKKICAILLLCLLLQKRNVTLSHAGSTLISRS